MKKTKYIYKHTIYGGGPNGFNDGEVMSFFEESGIKLYGSKKDNYFYSWEFAGDQCSWFVFFHKEEVELEEKVTKLLSENKYENGMNWKGVGKKVSNVRLRKPNTKPKKVDNKPSINPKTGLRDRKV